MGIFSKFIKPKRDIEGTLLFTSGGRGNQRRLDMERDALCNAIIDCNSTHIGRAQVLHVRKDLNGRISEVKRSSEYTKLFTHPNPMMTRQDFLYAMSWQLHLCNLAMAWVKWNGGHPAEVWPLIFLNYDIYERTAGGWAVKLIDMDGDRYTLPLEDLIVLRKRYNGVGYSGQDNSSVQSSLEMVASLDEGLKQAVEISNKIHGILRQKNAMLATDSVDKVQSSFFDRMKTAAQNGGAIALDATEDYTPINVSAWSANAAQQKQITDRVYTYWRTPLEVVQNTASEQTMQNYFDSIVEPVWEEMSEAFTQALFTKTEQNYGNCISVSSGAATGASWATKLSIVNSTKDIGLLTPNEYRELLGYAPVENGDERQVSLNYVKEGDQSAYQTGNDSDQSDNDQTETEGNTDDQ